MSPLSLFHVVSTALIRRPFEFWLPEEQQRFTKDLIEAIEKLQSSLASKGLSGGLAAQQLSALRATLGAGTLQEVTFVQGLRGLLAIYRMTTLPSETAKLLDDAAQSSAGAEQEILEYHLAIETLDTKKSTMAEKEREAHDNNILHEMGMFYVLEYTLQVQYECEHRAREEQSALLFEGLKVQTGNLPSLVSCMHSFKRELCYGIMDVPLRMQLLRIFFDLEDTLETRDRGTIRASLRKFNVALATILKNSGIGHFHPRLLISYDKDITFDDLIEKIDT